MKKISLLLLLFNSLIMFCQNYEFEEETDYQYQCSFIYNKRKCCYRTMSILSVFEHEILDHCYCSRCEMFFVNQDIAVTHYAADHSDARWGYSKYVSDLPVGKDIANPFIQKNIYQCSYYNKGIRCTNAYYRINDVFEHEFKKHNFCSRCDKKFSLEAIALSHYAKRHQNCCWKKEKYSPTEEIVKKLNQRPPSWQAHRKKQK